MPSNTHYIIDGSNLLHYSEFVKDYGGDVIMARQELAKLLGGIINEADGGGFAGGRSGIVSRVTIVYDVHSWLDRPVEKIFGVNVIYAFGKKHEQPADKEILSLLEKISRSGSAEELVLVSDDNSLRREVIYFGCRPMRCEEFWTKFGLDYR